jgi:E3 ubiquitin-protein ligase UBR4
MCSAVLDTLRAVNERVACHANAALYRSLANVLEFDGYYLESEPCSVCSDPETPFSVVPLSKLAVESKHTSTTQVVRLRRCAEVRQVSVAITLPGSRGSRLVKSIGVYYSAAEVADVGEITGNWSRWTLACRLKVAPSATTAEFTLPIAVAVHNLLFEFNDFYDTASSREKLMCPRCNRAVTNKHGTCDSCRENAYQCRQCRNINYEHLDAFLCNECGFCKHAKFAFSIDQRPTIVAPRVESEDERVAALAVIDRESVKAHEQYERIRAQHGPLAKLASTLSERDEHVRIVGAEQIIAQLPALASVSKKVFALAVLYGKECQQSFEALSQSTRVLLSTRRELQRYARATERADAVSASGSAARGDGAGRRRRRAAGRAAAPTALGAERHAGCFGCSMTYLTQCLLPLQQLALHESTRRRLVADGVIQELVSNNVRDGPLATRTSARRAVCLFTRGDLAATACSATCCAR